MSEEQFDSVIKQILANQTDEIIYLERGLLSQIEEGCKKGFNNVSPNLAIINVRGQSLGNPQELFNIFNSQLQFLDYFGNNWDAFNDVMCDYPNQAKIANFTTIIVNNISSLQGRNNTFLDLLKEARRRNAATRIYILVAMADKNNL